MNGQDVKISSRTQLLNKARQALNRGDPVEMLDALFASHYPDGLVRRLRKRWTDSLPSWEIEECVAAAVDTACCAASEGREVNDLGAWLWKTSMNCAHDRWTQDYSRRDPLDKATKLADLETGETFLEREEREAHEEDRRKEAIQIFRGLLSKVGEGQVRDVMELIVDAAAMELPDLPASSIAETLGIKVNAARALMSRGRKRFRRLAEQEGIAMPTDLPEIDTDHDE